MYNNQMYNNQMYNNGNGNLIFAALLIIWAIGRLTSKNHRW